MMLPSQVVEAIGDLFGPGRNILEDRAVQFTRRGEVYALLALLDEIPRPLIDLPHREYLEFMRCRASLPTALAMWTVGGQQPARPVLAYDPVEHLRQLLLRCSDELPTPETDLPLIEDLDLRRGIQDRLGTAWTDYEAREWMGATVFASNALEALLVWATKTHLSDPRADHLSLEKLIDGLKAGGMIRDATASHAHLARDARNLVHPGKAARSDSNFSRATALAAFAAVFAVIEDLARIT